jgi:hypothetical protein
MAALVVMWRFKPRVACIRTLLQLDLPNNTLSFAPDTSWNGRLMRGVLLSTGQLSNPYFFGDDNNGVIV